MSDNWELSPPKVPVDLPQNESSPPQVVLPQNESADLFKDLVTWRRKQLNLFALLAATSAWTAMQIYKYNFITLVSYIAIAAAVCLFFWGNIHRLLKREAPDLSELEISEEAAIGCANSLRRKCEEGVRLMFRVSVDSEWFVFVGAVASLYLLSLLAKQFDLLTLFFMGVVGGLTLPVIYVKNEGRIRGFGEVVGIKSRRFYSMAEDKFQMMKNKIAAGRGKVIKEKKME
ncbi:hypothetical protein ABFS82_08G046100 [Erythranthe guttata]|uniref:Reticulon-like protein n=1 Tax=Erythranthe guttata TaxID=4155 RepID=A0A022RWM1_ERYGU|nr:PREDICTED: reticulon-like protein B13 [Erythranthe guttata]EYU44361.1 hypothetical protein MIMGU_mgv1a013149mg [Erythranthe guttata]|eukprot:XP_012853085.1 PREDICTED: reticulon-like protein B13 [Erythranthe guttata]